MLMTGRTRLRGLLAAVIAPLVVVTSVATAPAHADPTGGDAGRQWTAATTAPGPHAGVAVERGLSVVMSDGVTLKADVYRPADAAGVPTGEPTPVVLSMTPYSKHLSGLTPALQEPGTARALDDAAAGLNPDQDYPSALDEAGALVQSGVAAVFGPSLALARHGYTQVIVDVRGTGDSAGVWDVLGEREQQDTLEVIDWASRLPGTTGRVGTKGVSYSAINQLQAAGKRPEALDAVFAVEPGVDLLRDVVAPGGAAGAGFLPLWLAAVNGIKWMPNVPAALTGGLAPGWLEGRTASPFTMGPELVRALTARSHAELAEIEMIGDSAFHAVRESDIEAIEAPTFVYGAWHDIFTHSQTRLYDRLTLPPGQKQVVMADGYHGVIGPGMGRDGGPPSLDALELAWFERWLKGVENGVDGYGPLTLRQPGGGWVSRTAFPEPGVEHRRLFLDAAPSGTAPGAGHDGTLAAAPGGAHTLTVAPSLNGLCSREAAEGVAGAGVIGGPQCTRDERHREQAGLTFTGAPAEVATEISGPIAVHLEVDHDAVDGHWSVAVSDVAPDGRSTQLTNGQVVTSLREVDRDGSTVLPDGVYADPRLSLRRDRAQPVRPGERVTLEIPTLPVSAVLRPGHRLRVSVFAGNLPRGLALGPALHEGALAPQRLRLDPAAPSWVVVPTVPAG